MKGLSLHLKNQIVSKGGNLIVKFTNFHIEDIKQWNIENAGVEIENDDNLPQVILDHDSGEYLLKTFADNMAPQLSVVREE